jgi:hypothetical protein
MKTFTKYFIRWWLFLLIYSKINSQTIFGDSIIRLVEFNKAECPIGPDFFKGECNDNWLKIDSYFDSLYFIRDSNLIRYFNSNSGYIFNESRARHNIVAINPYREVSKDRSIFKYNQYLNSLRYSDSSDLVKLNISLSQGNIDWLSSLANKVSIKSVCDLYLSTDDFELNQFLLIGGKSGVIDYPSPI